MNEIIFFLHTVCVIAFVLFALRLGKNALIAFLCLQGIFANLFVVKQIGLFGLNVTASDVFAIGGILSLNLLQEYFGKEAARKAIKISVISLLFFACMSKIHLLYAPSPFDETQGAFLQVFSSSTRIVLASITTFFLVQQIDIRLFSILKGKLVTRVATSLVISQLLDTVIFSFLGLYGIASSIFDIMVVSFLVKCIVIALSSPFTAFSKRMVKNAVSL